VAVGGRKSSWKDVDLILNNIPSSPEVVIYFSIQKYHGSLPRYRYRIMLSNLYRIAEANNLDEICVNCWNQLLNLSSRVPATLEKEEKIKWLMSQVEQLRSIKSPKEVQIITGNSDNEGDSDGEQISQKEDSKEEESGSVSSSASLVSSSASLVSTSASLVSSSVSVESQQTQEIAETQPL